MRLRRIASLTAFLAFGAVVVTSIVVYVVPQGRVAYWADWQLWGLSKEQWGAVHINSGILLLLSLLFHMYYNWKPLLRYLQSEHSRLQIFTGELNVALLLLGVVIAGTIAEIPPLSTTIAVSDGFKQRAALHYGEPPYGHAELSSLRSFAKKMAFNVEDVVTSLRREGIKVTNANQTLREIAHEHGISPQQLFDKMQTRSAQQSSAQPLKRKLPENPAPGTGNLTLDEFCTRYRLDADAVLQALQGANLTVHQGMTIKKIAQENRTNPIDIYHRIRELVREGPVQ